MLIKSYLEWDTNALLIEEQTIATYEVYLKEVYKYLKDVKNQQERLTELTEELDRKEEDLEMMGELIKEKDGAVKEKDEEINRLVLEKEKMINAIRKAKSIASPNNLIRSGSMLQSVATPEMNSEREEIFNDIVTEKPKKQSQMKRMCETCGRDISFRRTDAKYCVECAYVNKKEKDRSRFKKRINVYDKRGEVVQSEDEENGEDISDIIQDTKDEGESLDEGGESGNEGPEGSENDDEELSSGGGDDKK